MWQWLLEAVGVLLLLVLAYGAALVVRRRLISRHGGTFELSHRVRSSRTGRGWVLGLGRYSAERLEWFRVFSLSPRPRASWHRSQLAYQGWREPAGAEELSLYPGHLVIDVAGPDGPLELAMSPASLTGFQAWLEAGPPGTDWTRGVIP